MLLLVLAFVSAVLASTPLHPRWPASFSTTAIVHFGDRPRPDFTRWFYSKNQNIDRLDGLSEFAGELYFATRFFNHNQQREYAVFYQRDSSVQCYTRAITNPLPQPNFSNFTYIGQALINYVPVYHWAHRRGNDLFQFYDTQDTRQPVRFDAEQRGRPAIQINYSEFDSGSQSPNIFTIPSQILAICTPTQNNNAFSVGF